MLKQKIKFSLSIPGLTDFKVEFLACSSVGRTISPNEVTGRFLSIRPFSNSATSLFISKAGYHIVVKEGKKIGEPKLQKLTNANVSEIRVFLFFVCMASRRSLLFTGHFGNSEMYK